MWLRLKYEALACSGCVFSNVSGSIFLVIFGDFCNIHEKHPKRLQLWVTATAISIVYIEIVLMIGLRIIKTLFSIHNMSILCDVIDIVLIYVP